MDEPVPCKAQSMAGIQFVKGVGRRLGVGDTPPAPSAQPGRMAHGREASRGAGPRPEEVISREPWRVCPRTDGHAATDRPHAGCPAAAAVGSGAGDTRTPHGTMDHQTRGDVPGHRHRISRHWRVAPDPDQSVTRTHGAPAVGLRRHRGGLFVLGTQMLAPLHLVPQDTVDTMKENVQWLKEQVRSNSRATRDRQR
jgi:hypothetical protein